MRLQYKKNGKAVDVEVDDITLLNDGQYLNLCWNECRNAFKVFTDNAMNIAPSSGNSVLIQDIKR